ncbi:outer membrane lipoprotein carrier protein [Halospina denitrificans]|uniref:Outer-membrane lipoprotein carrier protein n=1 Tax=Halospina denitrificans TaxID=332522 RepID=A0A4R7JTC3_9GAMM|nr:outer membrane lipoprotein chaperone LolA [Halospina denitrificans]TDT41530.1 outer membrane lipoprotein carrier protein [Halospina denitrificans]
MPMRILLAVLALLLSVTAQGSGAKNNAEALSEMLSGYESYQADFTQTVTTDEGERIQESTGQVKARRGGDFYWHTDPPLEQTIVTAGDEVQVYDPDLLQMTVYPLEDRIASTPALLLSGEVVDLASSFKIRRQDEEERKVFILEPRDKDTLFLELAMVFKDGVLREMRLHDSLDQHSRLRFEEVVLNESIDDERFELDVPDNVDVIRNEREPG